MKQQPDKLFHERLEHHSMVAPEGAWNRIEQSLPAQQNKFFALKIAAAFVLLIVSIALLIPSGTNTTEQPLISENTSGTQKSSANEKVTTVDSASIVKLMNEAPSKKEKKNEPKIIQKKRKTSPINFSKSEPTLAVLEPASVQKTENKQPLIVPDNTADIAVTNSIEPDQTQQSIPSDKEQHVTIIVAVAEVNQKYLRTLPEEEATNADVSTSSFRKLLDKAASLKNNDTGLSELRQKKNEILALNFRNEKRERNN